MSSTTLDPVRRLTASSSLPQIAALEEPHGGFEVDVQLHYQVGHLAGNFRCIYKGTKGSLFCGSGGCSFVGWTLFFEKRVELDWKRVLQVVQTTRMDDDDKSTSKKNSCAASSSGITFIMQNDNEEYTFSGFVHAERVWTTLVNLHNKSLHDTIMDRFVVNIHDTTMTTREPLVTRTPLRTTLRRMSTDPVYPTSADGNQEANDDKSKTSVAQAAYLAAASVACNEEFRASTVSRNLAAKSLSGRRSFLSNSPIKYNGEVETSTTETSDDLQEAWKELTNGGASGQESYATVAIQDKVIPCTLDGFLAKFVDADALFSYSDYMQSSGDDVLQVTEWKRDENGVYSRILEYNHPVNAPLAPPMAKARKEQRYRKYGNEGLSIETDTFVQDVPMADCFFVTDRVLVEPVSGDGGAVIVCAEFDIRFVKSTMFRSLISNTTRSEFLKWFQGLGGYWSESIVSPIIESEQEAVTPRRQSSMFAGPVASVRVEETKAPVVVTSTGMLGTNPFLTVLVVLVLVMQMYIMMEMRSMKRAMMDMESNLEMRDLTCQT